MPTTLLRTMGWVAVIIFVIQALFVVVGPQISGTLNEEIEETGEKSVLASQGAALLVIAAGVLLAITMFTVREPPLERSRDPRTADAPAISGGTADERARLTAISDAGQELRLVVESISGERLRLMLVTENPIPATAHGSVEYQKSDIWGQQRLNEFSRWLVASIGFAGALFVLVDENAVLASVILVPQVYGLALSYAIVGGWTAWRTLQALVSSDQTT